jgi:hypothetical protein
MLEVQIQWCSSLVMTQPLKIIWVQRCLPNCTSWCSSYGILTNITPSTYCLGAALPGWFCPNFAYYFQLDGWPTDLSSLQMHSFLTQFECLPLILLHAQQYL